MASEFEFTEASQETVETFDGSNFEEQFADLVEAPTSWQEKVQEVIAASSYLEYFFLGFLLLYFLNYLVGSRQNRQLVVKMVERIEPLLSDQFIFVGPASTFSEDKANGSEVEIILPESADCFKVYCTGRDHCVGAVLTFNLKPRQCLLSMVYNFLATSVVGSNLSWVGKSNTMLLEGFEGGKKGNEEEAKRLRKKKKSPSGDYVTIEIILNATPSSEEALFVHSEDDFEAFRKMLAIVQNGPVYDLSQTNFGRGASVGAIMTKKLTKELVGEFSIFPELKLFTNPYNLRLSNKSYSSSTSAFDPAVTGELLQSHFTFLGEQSEALSVLFSQQADPLLSVAPTLEYFIWTDMNGRLVEGFEFLPANVLRGCFQVHAKDDFRSLLRAVQFMLFYVDVFSTSSSLQSNRPLSNAMQRNRSEVQRKIRGLEREEAEKKKEDEKAKKKEEERKAYFDMSKKEKERHDKKANKQKKKRMMKTMKVR